MNSLTIIAIALAATATGITIAGIILAGRQSNERRPGYITGEIQRRAGYAWPVPARACTPAPRLLVFEHESGARLRAAPGTIDVEGLEALGYKLVDVAEPPRPFLLERLGAPPEVIEAEWDRRRAEARESRKLFEASMCDRGGDAA